MYTSAPGTQYVHLRAWKIDATRRRSETDSPSEISITIIVSAPTPPTQRGCNVSDRASQYLNVIGSALSIMSVSATLFQARQTNVDFLAEANVRTAARNCFFDTTRRISEVDCRLWSVERDVVFELIETERLAISR
jgi:hypothetical protein